MFNINDPAMFELFPDLALPEHIGPEGSEMGMYGGRRGSTRTTMAHVENWLRLNAPDGVLTPAANARLEASEVWTGPRKHTERE